MLPMQGDSFKSYEDRNSMCGISLLETTKEIICYPVWCIAFISFLK